MHLFTAIAIPHDIRQRLSRLREDMPGARWSVPENYHITLSFLGEVSKEEAGRIVSALSSVREDSFSLSLKGAGSFAQGDHPQVLWAGVEGSGMLRRLKDRADIALGRGKEESYAPHVTLARLSQPDPARFSAFLVHHSFFEAGPFLADSFSLYKSRQTEGGYIYEPLATYPLG